MFIQVITGRVSDSDGLRRQNERWNQEIRAGAKGFLGSTGGITPDGRFVTLARFESAEAARANSERAEQSAWWAETEKCLDGVSFHEGTEVHELLGGGSDAAGFVQVMRGTVKDPSGVAALTADAQVEATLRELRPDLLGDVLVVHDDGTFTEAAYFRSEAEARAGESQEPPAAAREMFQRRDDVLRTDDYLDLPEPWLR